MKDEPPCYMICTTARSGSNLLCDYLTHEENLGKPWEFFNPRVIREGHAGKHFEFEGALPLTRYIAWLRREYCTPNQAFGVKVLFEEFSTLIHFRPFRELFEGSVKVFLSRRSIIDQAVSYYLAQTTGQWLATDESRVDPEDILFDFAALREVVDNLAWQNEQWRLVFDSFRSDIINLYTEDIVQRPDESIARVAANLGVSTSYNAKTTLVAQTSLKKREFVNLLRNGINSDLLSSTESINHNGLDILV